ENCPDIRNSRVIDIINELKSFGCSVDVFDPWADKEEVKHEYGLEILCSMEEIKNKRYEGIILAVSHNQFKELDFVSFRKNGAVVYDVKGILETNIVDHRL
ncbi:MAG: UDP binding domain-containing protein, partial [Ignavibacteriaceae bacterium]